MSGSSALYQVFGAPPPTIAPWLIGVPPATLQQWLADAQAAYQALITGSKPASVSYSQGAGQRMVTYTKTTTGMLTAHIRQLNAALGNVRPRRGIPVRF